MTTKALAIAVLVFALISSTSSWADCAPLEFTRNRGLERNAFYRSGDVAAHLALSGGHTPRVVVAFPAGNSATALLLSPLGGTLEWQAKPTLMPVHETTKQGEPLRGISTQVTAKVGSLDVDGAVLGSVRVLRDVLGGTALPPELTAAISVDKNVVTWQRRRIDGRAGYRLTVEVLHGRIETLGSGRLRFVGDHPDRLTLRLEALTGDDPLTGICPDRLLRPGTLHDRTLHDALAFLSYTDKLLAGSWRYNTYFGRDTLLIVEMLRDVLQPEPIEAGLRSVLDRLSIAGEVAHEESIGEFAAYQQRKAAGAGAGARLLDYNMIDEDFMLAPVLAGYLLDDAVGRSRAAGFVGSKSASGERYGAHVVRNLRFVVERARAFADDPQPANLIALKPGQVAGNWRDSRDGLGGGRYPYDVNAVLVPAALDAAGRLVASGLLDDDGGRDLDLRAIKRMRTVWAEKSSRPFWVRLTREDAQRRVADYASRIGADPRASIAALPQAGIEFPAIALDASAARIPVLHTDFAMAMLFGRPGERELQRGIEAMSRPFPAGLAMPIGLVSANAAYVPSQTQELFGADAYAGAVITSWQQALLIIGLTRQAARQSLSTPTRLLIDHAIGEMQQRMERTVELRADELWSWSLVGGQYVARRYGDRPADETEANPIQLWSTAYLGVRSVK